MKSRNSVLHGLKVALVFLTVLTTSCGEIIEEECDDFISVQRMMENTANGIPRGYYQLVVEGDILRNYPSNLLPTLNNYLYWRDLYWYYCRDDDAYYRDDYYYYGTYGYDRLFHDNALYYANLLLGYYRQAFHLYLDFDGVSSFAITTEPVDPGSSVIPFTMLSITDLGVGDINVNITHNSITTSRSFRLEYGEDLFASLETGSSLKLYIHNIHPVGENTLVDVISLSTLFNDTGNMESVSIEGSMNPERR